MMILLYMLCATRVPLDSQRGAGAEVGDANVEGDVDVGDDAERCVDVYGHVDGDCMRGSEGVCACLCACFFFAFTEAVVF